MQQCFLMVTPTTLSEAQAQFRIMLPCVLEEELSPSLHLAIGSELWFGLNAGMSDPDLSDFVVLPPNRQSGKTKLWNIFLFLNKCTCLPYCSPWIVCNNAIIKKSLYDWFRWSSNSDGFKQNGHSKVKMSLIDEVQKAPPSLARSLWLFVLLCPVEKGSGKSAWDVALSAGKSSGLDHDDS